MSHPNSSGPGAPPANRPVIERAGQHGSSSRSLVIFVLLGVLLAGLVVGADRLANHLVEQRVASEVQPTLGTIEAPTVDIQGFPFLTQAVTGSLSSVQLHAEGVGVTTERAMTVAEVDLVLKGVTSDDLFKTATAAQATGRARLDYAAIKDLTNYPVTFAEDGKVKVEISSDLLGRQLVASVTGRPSLDVQKQTLTLADPQLSVAGLELPQSAVDSLLRSVVKPVPITGLPFDITLSAVTAEETGLFIDLEGSNVPLR